MGYCPTLKNEVLQGVEAVCNGAGEVRAGAAGLSTLRCAVTVVSVVPSLTDEYPAVLCASQIEILA